MGKESYTAVLSRLDERLNNLINSNDKEHGEIIKRLTDLCQHVNEENSKIDARVKKLEESEVTRKVQWKTLMLLIGGTSGLSIGLTKLIELLGGI
jgi:hypothetical protein